MEITNRKWSQTSKETTFAADASDLGISPGVHPSASYEARDPWDRELPHLFQVWKTEGEVGWSTTVRSPDGRAVRLLVLND